MRGTMDTSDAVALLAVAISIVTLVAIFQTRNSSARESALAQIMGQADTLNQLFVEFNVVGPVALKAPPETVPDRSEESLLRYQRKAILLLAQVNFFYRVFLFRDTLNTIEVEALQRWARTVLRDWIYADPELVAAYSEIRRGDTYAQSFLTDWLPVKSS